MPGAPSASWWRTSGACATLSSGCSTDRGDHDARAAGRSQPSLPETRPPDRPTTTRRRALMTTMSPFRAQLEQAVNARHSRMNPFTEKWVTGALTRSQLGAWARQHYQYVSQFPRWCASVYGEG